MSEALLTARPAEEVPVSPAIDPRKQELTRVLEARALQGYTVESLNDTHAVIVARGRRRLFGMRSGVDQRTEVTIDGAGQAVSRRI